MKTFLALLAFLAFLAPWVDADDSGWVQGDVKAVWVGGEDIRRGVEEWVNAARTSLDVEMYTFGDKALAEALVRRAEAGVRVRVILDRESEVNRAMRRYLDAHGIPTVFYPTEADAIDHVKLLVVDGRLAVIGGANWGEHSPENFDVAVGLEGDVVRVCGDLWERDRQKSQGKKVPSPPPAAAVRPDRARHVRVVTDTDIRRVVADELGAARTSIDVAMYVLTDRPLVSQLIDAHRSGIRVRVVLDPGDDQVLNQKMFDRLRRAGVAVQWYRADQRRGEKFHVKMAVIDGRTAVLGSANWTARGLKANHECVIVLPNLDTVQRLHHVFQSVWVRGRSR